MKTFQDKLQAIEDSNLYPFHMPGHKRVVINSNLSNPYLRDITEIDEYDNLHNPTDFIADEQRFAAELFGAQESFYLVNGSSCGILAAIMTVSNDNSKKILVARNSHKSLYNGLYLARKEADYIYPSLSEKYDFNGSVSLQQISELLDQNDYEAIFITSPTYEGIISDISKICEIAHKKSIPVIVDEAHGAYLGIFGDDDYFPQSAVKCGADIVIQSTHKTLPAMTQTALLHVQGDLVDREKLRQQLSIFQSSSPSYILMESISDSLHYCFEKKVELSNSYKKKLVSFYKKVQGLRNLHVIQNDEMMLPFSYRKDPGKLIIELHKNIKYNGKQLSDCLREKYQLQMEMAEQHYVIAMTSIMDTEIGLKRLIDALYEIDMQLDAMKLDNMRSEESETVYQNSSLLPITSAMLSIADAFSAEKSYVLEDEAVGKISAEYIYLYPPDVPILVPGEQITKELLDFIKDKKAAGLSIQGPAQYEKGLIACVSN